MTLRPTHSRLTPNDHRPCRKVRWLPIVFDDRPSRFLARRYSSTRAPLPAPQLEPHWNHGAPEGTPRTRPKPRRVGLRFQAFAGFRASLVAEASGVAGAGFEPATFGL